MNMHENTSEDVFFIVKLKNYMKIGKTKLIVSSMRDVD